MFTEPVQSRATRAAATHQRVLEAAERLFRTQGFGATTIRQIAQDAGVSVGTVMAVGDKDALLVAVFDGWIEAVHEGRAPYDPPAAIGTTAVHDVLAVVEPFLTYFASDRDLARHYSAIIARGSHESRIFQSLALALVGEMSAALERHGLAPPEALRGAKVIYFAYLGLLMTLSNGAIDEATALQEFCDVIDFVAPTGSSST